MSVISAFLGLGLLFSEVALARRRRSSQAVGDRKLDASSLCVLWIVTMTAITLGIWLAMAGIGPRLPLRGIWGWIGLGVFGLGTAVRWWSISHLGRFFTVDVAIAADHRVVDTGPYRLVRHPSYSGLLMQFAGFTLALGNRLSVVVILLPISVALLYRIRVEEAALLSGLGEGYVSYMQRTKRLLPWVF